MLLNYSVVEDSWESLGLQGDQISQSQRTSVLNIHWKEWCWSWSSNILATWCEELTHWKDSDAGKDWKQEKGTTEDEMVGWHHRLDGHEFEWTLRVCGGPGSLACCSLWGQKESDTTEWLTETWGSKPSKSLYLLFCIDLQMWSFSPKYKAIPLSILAMLWLFELLLLEVRVAQQSIPKLTKPRRGFSFFLAPWQCTPRIPGACFYSGNGLQFGDLHGPLN